MSRVDGVRVCGKRAGVTYLEMQTGNDGECLSEKVSCGFSEHGNWCVDSITECPITDMHFINATDVDRMQAMGYQVS